MNITFTNETIDMINLCEKITRAKIKDIRFNNNLILIVEKGDASKAIGKKGVNIKKLSNLLKKKIKIVEFDPDPIKFTENFILPVKGKVYKENETILIEIKEFKDKGIVIGRNKKNIKHLEELLSKYFKLSIKTI